MSRIPEAYPCPRLGPGSTGGESLDVSVANPYADFTANFMGRRWPIAILLSGTRQCILRTLLFRGGNNYFQDLRLEKFKLHTISNTFA